MDFKYITVTLDDLTSASGWTAPYAGIMMANIPGNKTNAVGAFYVNGTLVSLNGTAENLYRGSTFAVPKGGVVTVADMSGSNNFYAVFAYVTGNAVLSQSITNLQATLPYSLNRSSNIGNFNRKWLVDGSPITWTATHTGRLTVRCLKHGDGYSLYLTNQSGVLLDSYDNFFGDDAHGTAVTDASITLQAWVKKGDVIKLETNLPASTDWANKYFVQLGLLLYNSNYD